MNIFFLSPDFSEAARFHADIHLRKMIVESAQMLSTAHRLYDGKLTMQFAQTKSGKNKFKGFFILPDQEMNRVIYQATHYNHPCTVWTLASIENYNLHYAFWRKLCEEYTFRTGKIHKTDSLLRDKLATPPANIRAGEGPTPFPLCMKSRPDLIDRENPYESYRNFYKTKKDRMKMTWTKREIPSFMKD